jgi:hypothetical protein
LKIRVQADADIDPDIRKGLLLNELLAQCDPKAPRSKQEQEWLDSKPVGSELI